MFKKKRILIVEDEEALAEMLQMRFEARGYKTFVAFDGKKALEMVLSKLPDLIILDVMIPEMDGFKVCERLKLQEKFRDIPIILLTAQGAEGDLQMARRVGATDHIVKPFEPEDLMKRVEEVI